MAEMERLGVYLPTAQNPPPSDTLSSHNSTDDSYPADCWCNGRGGAEVRFIPDMDGGGIPVFGQCCTCPEGRAEQARKDLETQAYHARQATIRARKYFELSSVPTRFAHFRFSTFPATDDATREIVGQLRYWSTHGAQEVGRESILLYGPYGVGKTGLAVAAMREAAVTRRLAALFVAAPDLLDKIRASYGGANADGTAEELVQAVKNIELLILDDLGAERPTDWVREKLFSLINHRHDQCLPTIFTSNLSPTDLADHLGERTSWRIVEMSTVLHVQGQNLRARPQGRLPYVDD